MMFKENNGQSIEQVQESQSVEVANDPTWKRIGRAIGGTALVGGFIAFGIGIGLNFSSPDVQDTMDARIVETPLHKTQNQEGSGLLFAGLAGMSVGLCTMLVCANRDSETYDA